MMQRVGGAAERAQQQLLCCSFVPPLLLWSLHLTHRKGKLWGQASVECVEQVMTAMPGAMMMTMAAAWTGLVTKGRRPWHSMRRVGQMFQLHLFIQEPNTYNSQQLCSPSDTCA